MESLSLGSGRAYGIVAQGAAITATNTTANQSLVSFNVPAGAWAPQDLWVFESRVYASRGATATAANLVLELLINGVVVRTLTLAINTTASTNRAADVIGKISCFTTGAAGTILTSLAAFHDITGTAGAVSRALDPAPAASAPATTAIDTTQVRSLELRMRMSAAVAALTIYAAHPVLHRAK